MQEKNFEFLSKQVMYSGFGEGHAGELKAKMEQGLPDFVLFHQQDYGKDNTVATLQFRKGDEGDVYFFNRFSLMLKNEQHPEPLKQTFCIYNKQDNITLKEAYNLMSGRSVYKELTTKEGEKYNAWLQLDFKNIDKNGNFETKKFNQNYGFDLEATLAKHPIKELNDPEAKKNLVESLQRGNRQSVTVTHDSKEQKLFIEASPKYKSVNFYDGTMQRVQAHSFTQKEPSGERQIKGQEKKETMKKDNAAGDEEGGVEKKSQQRRPQKGMNA